MENFEKLLYSLPKEVQEHFQKKIFVSSLPEDGDIWAKIDSMSTKELSQLIIAIAQRIPEVDKLQKV